MRSTLGQEVKDLKKRLARQRETFEIQLKESIDRYVEQFGSERKTLLARLKQARENQGTGNNQELVEELDRLRN